MAAIFGARVGAAAFVLGLSVVGPHAGVAAADTGDSEVSSPSVSVGGSGQRESVGRSSRSGSVGRVGASTPPGPRPVAGVGRSGARVVPVPGASVSVSPSRSGVESGGSGGSGSVGSGSVGSDAVGSDAVGSVGGGVGSEVGAAVAGSGVVRGSVVVSPRLGVLRSRTVSAPAGPLPPLASAPAASVAVVGGGTVGAGSVVSSGNGGCAACWGVGAPSITAAVSTVVNHVFNSAFSWLAGFPANPISDLVGGALVLIRRALFLVPEGVAVSQTNSSLMVSVNTGSVAYVRQDGSMVQISGDPWFFGAKSFSDATAVTMSVSNPGNAGCAGLVVASGTVNADHLVTTGIDSLRFNQGAAVSGTVSATVAGGVLSVRDAVRGLGGVQFNAPVVLVNDVEIDAGTGDAMFAGTVDAADFGEQSLIVTALGATTFGAAVGGQTPLAGLLTRAITPLSITQSADTKTIPLRYLPTYNANGQPQVKYGIDVAIGNNPSQIYEFDTGGTAFYAGYSPSFWQNVPLSTNGIAVTYSSGNFYDAVVSNTVITIGAGSQTVSTGQPIQVGAILNGGNSNTQAVFDFTNPAAPPVESHFFGDFGASFAVAPGTGLPLPMANPLFQLPGNLSSGFLVQLGPIGVTPQLSVGITDALRDQFPYAIPVAQLVGGGTYPVSGYPVLQEFGFFPRYFAQDGTNPKQPIGTEVFPQCQTGAQCLPTLIDSGAPTTGIRLKGIPGGDPYNDSGQLRSGVTFIAEFPTAQGRPPLEWMFTAGETRSVDLVNYEDGAVATDTQNVNTGLTLYNYYDVMFDVQEQVIWLRPTGGQSTVTLNSVTTTGDQIYRQNAQLAGSYLTNGGSFSVAGVTTLAGDTTVGARGGDVTFAGTVDGAHSVVVNASGATAFVRGVGVNTALVSLTTDSGGSTATAGVTTTGSQRYGDDVTLSGPYRTTDGDFAVAGSAGLAGPASIETGGDRTITFAGTIDSQPSRGLTLSLTTAGGDIALGGDVGAVNPLGGLILASTASSGVISATAAGAINLDGNLSFANAKGLAVGKSVTVDFTNGGLIQNFSQDGITLDQNDNSTLSGFIVSNNAGDGIKATSVNDLVLADNAVIGNGAAGITVAGGKNVTITGSSILGGRGDGIQLTGTQNPVVNTEDVSISDNTITGNADYGIDAENANRLTITGNTINTNGKSGILSLSTDDVVISGNTISGNTKDGVAVDQGTGNRILANSISLNVVKGISLQNGGNNNQVAPTVASAVIADGRLIVTGTLADQSSDYTLQVFYSPAPVNQAPPVQGTQLLQSSTETTSAFSVNVPGGSLWAGDYVTVTATVSDDTSAFSAPMLITLAP